MISINIWEVLEISQIPKTTQVLNCIDFNPMDMKIHQFLKILSMTRDNSKDNT